MWRADEAERGIAVTFRDAPKPGDMMVVDPGYHSGIWLRSHPDISTSPSSSKIPPESRVLVVDVIGENVYVVGEGGIVGWTWTSRLKSIE